MTTIIFVHPWHGSFNKAILDTVTQKLETHDEKFNIIDLNKDEFDPVLREADLKLYSAGKSADPLVEKYQNLLNNTTRLIFIFPIWWYDVPAVLKGFIDKVMLKHFAYKESTLGIEGKLNHIKQTMVITTSESPTWYLKFFAHNPIENNFIKNTLNAVGLKNIKWINNSQTKSGSDRERKQFLKVVQRYLKRIYFFK